MYLIYESMERKKKNYSNGVSSFILEDNLLSMTLCKKLAVDINKEYSCLPSSYDVFASFQLFSSIEVNLLGFIKL